MLVKVQREDFDVGAELDALTRGRLGVGGMTSFLGLVRDIHGDARVGAMTLEHFPGMTERELGRISAEAHARWPLEATLVVHRFGRLEPGDRIVLCAAASAHRQAAFDACAFLIDFLKTRAPFWKLEATDAGERWVEARASDDDAAARWDAPR
ncbi:MAG: molybdenum cofactor biosynthesis protein MoaE [Alphaproteobacteria bacterium]|nr:molybdenum cofactor biosynthesis protein MoaE [Alphaproteobacteria bacterium]MBM3626299.1 molybdenum cofactor biosynthesis protein MoaE [Alphaproteobacteria bacterium]